jgi:hypothetical protein
MRLDFTVATDDEGLVFHYGWTVRDASGEAVAIGSEQLLQGERLELPDAVTHAVNSALDSVRSIAGLPALDHELGMVETPMSHRMFP